MSKTNYIQHNLKKRQRFQTRQLYLAPFVGALAVLAFAPFNLWFFAIIAPALLLYFWHYCAPKHAFYVGLLYGLGYFGFGCSWVFISIHRFGGAPLWLAVIATALFIGVLSLFQGVGGYVLRRYFNKNRALTSLCAFPAIYTSFDWLRGIVATGFPWLTLGYSQTTSPLSALAPVIGVYGITLVLALLAGALVALCQKLSRRSHLFASSIILLTVLFCWLLHDTMWTTPSAKPTPVSLVQGNIAQSQKWTPSSLNNILATYIALSKNDWNHSLVVWPEAAVPIIPQRIMPLLSAIKENVIVHQSSLITGIPFYNQTTGNVFNGALLLGSTSGHYAKRHLVPFGEYFPLKSVFGWAYRLIHIPMSNMTPGAPNQALFYAQNMYIAPYICYEIAFPDEIIQTLRGANAITVISDDTWFGDSLAGSQHMQMAAMAAQETGRYVLFDSNSGPSAIINSLGDITTISPKDQPYSLNGSFYAMYGTTPFLVLGSHTTGLAILILLIIVILVRKDSDLVEKYSI